METAVFAIEIDGTWTVGTGTDPFFAAENSSPASNQDDAISQARKLAQSLSLKAYEVHSDPETGDLADFRQI